MSCFKKKLFFKCKVYYVFSSVANTVYQDFFQNQTRSLWLIFLCLPHFGKYFSKGTTAAEFLLSGKESRELQVKGVLVLKTASPTCQVHLDLRLDYSP